VRLDTTLIAVEAGRRLATAEVTSRPSALIAEESTLEVEVDGDVRELAAADEEALLDPSANVTDIIWNKVLRKN
jgi:hypothetical protein